LLAPGGSTREAFTLVQKHRDWLRPWFAHHAGWQLTLDSEAARLIKRPARLEDATRACREPNSDAPLNRRAYVILCLARFSRPSRPTNDTRSAAGFHRRSGACRAALRYGGRSD
jgi:uncharacterized protein (TIGR02678 family)